MGFLWRADDRISIARNPYIFVIFQGGGGSGLPSSPMDPRMHHHCYVLSVMCFFFDLLLQNSLRFGHSECYSVMMTQNSLTCHSAVMSELFTVRLKIHNNRTILFFIETGK